MLLNTNKLQEEIMKYENNKEKEEFYQLLLSCFETLIELETHKGRRIKIGNNDAAQLNEEEYILKDYALYKVRDGLHTLEYGITLIITVADHNNEELSFSFDYINDISIDLVNPKILKVHIRTRNRVFDYDTYMLKRVPNSRSEDIKEFIHTRCYSTRRFFLYDDE